MTTFVCVQSENYCGRGAEYVNILYDSVMRNLEVDKRCKFVCFTDNNDGLHHGIEVRPLHGKLNGWWNKLWLFKDGHFPDNERIIYLDLDTVIVGNIEKLFSYDGSFAILRDFYRPEGLGSGIMMWKPWTAGYIWREYESAMFPDLIGGDQAFIEKTAISPDILQDIFPDLICSYKVSGGKMPDKASIVCFHGHPRPHEVNTDWVPKIWRVGGQSRAEIKTACNTDSGTLIENIKSACDRDIEWHLPKEDGGSVCIVGGGPSLRGSVNFIKARKHYGQKIWAINGAYNYLLDNGIISDALIVTDARQENIEFVKRADRETTFYIASQCDPSIFDALADFKVILVHLNVPGVPEIVMDMHPHKYTCFLASPGGTSGMTALYLAKSCGYKDVTLYGMDSCYFDGDNHAYTQELNNGERIIDVSCGEKSFRCAPWMSEQAKAFSEFLPEYLDGINLSVAGDGLLAEIVKQYNSSDSPFRNRGGYLWPADDTKAYGPIKKDAENIQKILSNHVRGFDICVQAGGNCGLWPIELSERFGAVYTFEPDPVNFSCLEQNCRGRNNIVKIQGLVGKTRKTRGLSDWGMNCGSGFADGEGIYPVFRIDDLGLSGCSLIYLDIEGMEYDAIMGAEETIKKFGPVIVCEEKGQGHRFGHGPEAINDFLYELGYSFAAVYGKDRVYQQRSK